MTVRKTWGIDMGKLVLIDEDRLVDIADAIRDMKGTHNKITVDSMPREIKDVEIVWDPDEKWQRPLDWPDYDSLNLFKNKIGKSICTAGKYFGSDGEFRPDSGWYYTDYIDIKPKTSYVASSISRGGANTYYVLYDKDKVMTRTVLIVANENPSFTTAENEYYVRFSIRNHDNELETAQLEEGTVATEYSPFFEGMYFTYDTTRADHYDNFVGLYCVCSGGYKVDRGQIVNGEFVVEETTNMGSGTTFSEWIESTITGHVVYRITAATAGQPITSIGLRDLPADMRTDGRVNRTFYFQPIEERYGRLPNLTSFYNWGNYYVVSDTIWDLKKLTSLSAVWNVCYAIENIDITGFDSEVISCSQSFYYCRSLRYLNETDKLVTSKCTTMYTMFNDCNNIRFIDCGGWDTSNVTRMDSAFSGCANLYKLDVSHWNVSKVTIMTYLFYNCTKLREIDVSDWVVTLPTSYYYLFCNCYRVEKLDVSGFDSTNVTTMYDMFASCYSLKELDVSHFNTSKCTNFYGMFQSCRSLKELDVSNFDTSKATTVAAMFNALYNLKDLDLSNFDLSSCAAINSFCSGATSYGTNLHLPSTLTTAKISGSLLNSAFSSLYAVRSIDLSNCDFSGVTAPDSTFRYDSSIEEIILPATLKYIGPYFFGDCRNLKTIVLRSTTVVALTNTNAFSGANRDKTIYVPDNLVASYQAANNWKSLSHVTFAGLSTYTG